MDDREARPKRKRDEDIETDGEAELLGQEKEPDEQAQLEDQQGGSKKHKVDKEEAVQAEELRLARDDPKLVSLKEGLQFLMDKVPGARHHLQTLGPLAVKALDKLIIAGQFVNQGLEAAEKARPHLRTAATILRTLCKGLSGFLEWIMPQYPIVHTSLKALADVLDRVREFEQAIPSLQPVAETVKAGLKVFVQWRDCALMVVKAVATEVEKPRTVAQSENKENKERKETEEEREKEGEKGKEKEGVREKQMRKQTQ